MNKKQLAVLILFCFFSAQAAAEVSERAVLDSQLARVRRQFLVKEKARIEEKLEKVCQQRIDLERRKRAVEEERLVYLLSRRLCADEQPAAAPPQNYALPLPSDTGDLLGKELDSLLEKQDQLTQRGLALENELKAATEK